MINFLDIHWDANFIYAIAEVIDCDFKKYEVSVSLNSEDYIIKGIDDDFAKFIIIKGLIHLKFDFKKRKKLNKNETIAWY